jgi:hypothetical protein
LGAALDLLSYFRVTLENTPDFERYRDCTIQFFTTITDKRLRLLGLTPRPIRLRRGDAGPDDFALTPLISNRLWIAVPAAVSGLPFFYEKAWVVEPFDPDAPPESPADEHWPKCPPSDLAADDTRLEDICPVLTSDFADRRIQPGEIVNGRHLTAWRLRRRNRIFGHRANLTDDGGVCVRLMRRQKIYGASDYDWKQIGAAQQRLLGTDTQGKSLMGGAFDFEAD